MTPTDLLQPTHAQISALVAFFLTWLTLHFYDRRAAPLAGLWVAAAMFTPYPPDLSDGRRLGLAGAGVVLALLPGAAARTRELFHALPWSAAQELAREVLPPNAEPVIEALPRLLLQSLHALVALLGLVAVAAGFGLPGLGGVLGAYASLLVGLLTAALVAGSGVLTMAVWQRTGGELRGRSAVTLGIGLTATLALAQALPVVALIGLLLLAVFVLPQGQGVVAELLAGLELHNRSLVGTTVVFDGAQVQVKDVQLLGTLVTDEAGERTVPNTALLAALSPLVPAS